MRGLNFRLSLGHQIFLIGGGGVFGILLVAGIYFLGESSLARYQNQSDAAALVGALTNSTEIKLLDARRAEKDFLLRNDDKQVKRHGDLSQSIRDNLKRLKGEIERDNRSDLAVKADAVAVEFLNYTNHFGSLAEAKRKLGLTPDTGLEGTLRGSVHAIESILQGFNDASLNAAMLTMRRNEKDFMLRHDAKYGVEMKKAAEDFSRLLAAAAIPDASKRDMTEKLTAYQRDFFAYTTEFNNVVAAQKSMSDSYAKMEPVFEQLGVAVRQQNDAAQAAAAEVRTAVAQRMATSLVVILLAVGMVAFIVARGIVRPIKGLVAELKKLAEGDFNVTLPWVSRRDEIGDISSAIGIVVKKVGNAIARIKVAAIEVADASREIASSTTDLSQRTEEQAASLEQISASMEQISSTVKLNAENARAADSSSGASRKVSDLGGAVVTRAIDSMAQIEGSSRKIADIIGVIDEIARQTNLLALNAAVEAARAGDAGRGFAVVASEVRSLAQRSAQAAKDINGLITSSDTQVKDGVSLVGQAGKTLTEMMESIRSVSTIVTSIATASAEQSSGVDQITRAITQMDQVTQQNSALVEENAATAKALEYQAQLMNELVLFFKVEPADTEKAIATRATPMVRRAAA